MERFPEVSVTATETSMRERWRCSHGYFTSTITSWILSPSITRQIKPQFLNANEEQRRDGLDSALIGKAVTSNTPGASWLIVQFYPEWGLQDYISLYISTVLTFAVLTLSSIMTRSLGSVRSIFNTLCLVCAWLVPTKKYLCHGRYSTKANANTIYYKHMCSIKISCWHLSYSVCIVFCWNTAA